MRASKIQRRKKKQVPRPSGLGMTPFGPGVSTENYFLGIFFRSAMKLCICSWRDFSSGARRMEEGWTVAMTIEARSDSRNSPRC